MNFCLSSRAMLLSVIPSLSLYSLCQDAQPCSLFLVMSVLKIPVEKDQQNIHVEKFYEKEFCCSKSYSRGIP